MGDHRKAETQRMTKHFDACFKSAKEKLQEDKGDTSELLKNLILQGLLLLCEANVAFRCLEEDKSTVQGMIESIQDAYSSKIKELTSEGVDRKVTLTISEEALDKTKD